MGVQNLALRYLRQQDPAAYGDYRSGADGATFAALVNGFGRVAFEAPGNSPREREFGCALLRRDQRRFSDDKSGGLTLIQRSAEARPEVWNNEQFLRLIFAADFCQSGGGGQPAGKS